MTVSGPQSPFSFRDPAGRLVVSEGRLLRIVSPAAVDDVRSFLGSGQAKERFESGELVRTVEAAPVACVETGAEPGALVLEHDWIEFPSYPYEWSPAMLAEAARLTLDLAEGMLSGGFGLKDATPYNILFKGPRAVFVDILSFERRNPRDPIWIAFGQYVRTFLLPLLVTRWLGIPLAQIFLAERDGITPEQVYRQIGVWNRWRSPALGLVTLPVWLSGRAEAEGRALHEKRLMADSRQAAYVLKSTWKRLRRALGKLSAPAGNESAWSNYMEARPSHYSDEQFGAKERVVREVLGAAPHGRYEKVLDIGCNTGHFSRIAAGLGARVVAVDSDAMVVDRVWEAAHKAGTAILPLVVNIARPSPAVGWRYGECRSFLDRARGQFDAVLMLGLIHHLLVTERIPLGEILSLGAELTRRILVIEFVAPEDPMFQRIVRGRQKLSEGLCEAAFEAAALERFEIVRRERLPGGHRTLYVLAKNN